MIDPTKSANRNLSSSIRQSIPLRAGFRIELNAALRKRLSKIADKFLDNEPALCSTQYFGSQVNCGLHSEGPALLIADQSEIALFGEPESGLLEYRMALLGEPGDMLVLSHDRNEDFEAYLGDYLGIDDLEVLLAEKSLPRWPLAKRCQHNTELFEAICRKARDTGVLSIVTYITSGHIWNLAARIAKETSAQIMVAGPPPRLAKRVNDKIWFSNLVKDVLGQSALSPSIAVYGPCALAGNVKRLANKTERLVIKVPNSAGGHGNFSIEASMFRDLSLTSIRTKLLEILSGLGWAGNFPLKIELWETSVLVSPSAQIWIPRINEGLPIIEGLFEQVVEGPEGKFIGAIKSQLPKSLQQLMAEQAMALAYVFQQLGYYGRCSFDALVSGTSYDDAKLHWIECNGRWGGVSIPMTAANRLMPEGEEYQFMVVQKSDLNLPPRPFQGALNALRDILFKQGSREGVVFLTPTSYESGSGMHYMAIAETLKRARDLSRQTGQRLMD
ncbi:MAG: hypothetical protein COB78_00085 [Hyphomicrobiales bacterium]|nr:MAG: hypothetical protein COB78_00085 [Hyphomicrobiales bacterium]